MSSHESPTETLATYPMPEGGWQCFHCGDRFTTVGAASDHFGGKPDATTACRIKFGDELGLVMELRKAETSRDEWMDQCLATRSENESLECQIQSLTTAMQSYAPFRDCHSINDVFFVYDSTEGQLLALQQSLETELNNAERHAWESLSRFKFWHFGFWAGVWSIINRAGNLGRNLPWREFTNGAALEVSQLPSPGSNANDTTSIHPQ